MSQKNREDPDNSPPFVSMKMYHRDMVKLERRLTRVEVLVFVASGVINPIVAAFVLKYLLGG